MQSTARTQQEILGSERNIWPGELAFSEVTYLDRLELIQKELLTRGLCGALIFDPENMYWLTGYQTIGYFTFQTMFVPVSGKPVMITRVVNRDMALALPTIGSISRYMSK